MSGDGVNWSRFGWIGVGVVLAVAFLSVLYSFVGTFVFGIFVYYATRPVYRRLRRRTAYKSVAAAVSILALALPALVLFAFVVAIGLQQLDAVVRSFHLGVLGEAIAPYVDISTIVSDPWAAIRTIDMEQLLALDPGVNQVIQTVITEIGRYLGFVGNALLQLFVMLALSFYLLRDGPRASRWVLEQFDDELLERYLRAVDADLSSIFFGNILNAVLTGIIGAISYAALNQIGAIPYPELLGLVMGVASLIPVVGMKLVYVPVAVYLFAQQLSQPESLWFVGLFVVVSFVIVDTLPDLVLRPYVSGRNLHVGMVMFAYIFGPLLFGWYGIFLGPMLLVFGYQFALVVLPELLTDTDSR